MENLFVLRTIQIKIRRDIYRRPIARSFFLDTNILRIQELKLVVFDWIFGYVWEELLFSEVLVKLREIGNIEYVVVVFLEVGFKS